MKTLQDYNAQLEAAQIEMDEAKAFLSLFTKYPQYACEANRALLKEFHHGETITLKSLLESVQFLQNELAVKSDKRIEKDALAERAELLENYKTAMSGFSSGAIQSKLNEARYLSNPKIAEETEKIQETKILTSKSPIEIKQIIKNSRPAPEEIELPAEYTRAKILSLDSSSLRRLIEKCTAAVVTKALNERR